MGLKNQHFISQRKNFCLRFEEGKVLLFMYSSTLSLGFSCPDAKPIRKAVMSFFMQLVSERVLLRYMLGRNGWEKSDFSGMHSL